MEVKIAHGKLRGHYMPKAFEVWYRRHWWSDWEFVKDINGNPRVVLTKQLAEKISTEVLFVVSMEEAEKKWWQLAWDCIKTIVRRLWRRIKPYLNRIIGKY